MSHAPSSTRPLVPKYLGIPWGRSLPAPMGRPRRRRTYPLPRTVCRCARWRTWVLATVERPPRLKAIFVSGDHFGQPLCASTGATTPSEAITGRGPRAPASRPYRIPVSRSSPGGLAAAGPAGVPFGHLWACPQDTARARPARCVPARPGSRPSTCPRSRSSSRTCLGQRWTGRGCTWGSRRRRAAPCVGRAVQPR